MMAYQERALTARQIAQIRQLQLQKAQAEESVARSAAQRDRVAHEQAVADELECRAAHIRALDGGGMVDVLILQQWLHMSAAAQAKVTSLAAERDKTQSALQRAAATVQAGEQRLDDARDRVRLADKRLQKKIDEKKLESIEWLSGARTA